MRRIRKNTLPSLKAYLCLWQADIRAHRSPRHKDYRTVTGLTGHKTLQVPSNFAEVNIDDDFTLWYHQNFYVNSSDKDYQRPFVYVAAATTNKVNVVRKAELQQSKPTQLTLSMSNESKPIDWRWITITTAQQMLAKADNVDVTKVVIATQELTKALKELLK